METYIATVFGTAWLSLTKYAIFFDFFHILVDLVRIVEALV